MFKTFNLPEPKTLSEAISFGVCTVVPLSLVAALCLPPSLLGLGYFVLGIANGCLATLAIVNQIFDVYV